jgi:tetratricopeptide (TPR) repeat protein
MDPVTTTIGSVSGMMGGFFSISKGAWVGYAFFGVVLALGVFIGKKYLAMQGGALFDPIREAKRAKKDGDFIHAAEIYARLGEDEEAIAAYKEAKAYFPIGHIYEQKRQWQESAQYYKLAGNIEKATEMYQKGGAYLQAAEGYLMSKKFSMAAEMLEKGRRPKEAAEQYEKIGNFTKAAMLYEQANLQEKAAEVYETYFLKQRMGTAGLMLAGPTSQRTDQAEQTQQAAYKSGQLYLQVKKYQKAIDIFSTGGFLMEAAEAAEAGGEIEKAANLYVSAKGFDRASVLYEKMGNGRQYFRIMAKRYQEEGNYADAAPAFEKGECWADAAEMYENIGEKESAAAMFMKSGDYHRAGELFLALGNAEQAALAFENGGRFKEAASLYEKLEQHEKAAAMHEYAMNYYQAAVLFHQQGKADETISCLQKVDAQAADYFSASLLLGKMLIERGLVDAARERFQRIVAQDSISSTNIEFYYQLALIHENENEFDKAQGLYEKILADNFSYRDVRERNQEIKQKKLDISRAKEGLRTDSVTAPILQPGQSKRYQIIQKIGQGGMGAVYKAQDTVLKRVVAYKVIPAAIKDNREMLQGFMQEAQIAAGLNHPNIVTLFDTGTHDDEVFLTMEFVDGISLKEQLEKTALPISDMIGIMTQICDGVAYAHSQEVIHRDIKPANIMLTRSQMVKITDFGLARILSETTGARTTIKGTPLYMGPEQILGDKVDQQSDIYSIGCTFYRMMTGRAPFMQGDIFYHHLHTVPTPPKTHNPALPELLNQLILKCLEKDKAKRYLTVTDLVADLERCTHAMTTA